MEPGNKVYKEVHLWIRVCELGGCHDQLNNGASSVLHHVARVIRSFCQRIEWRGFGRLVEPACGGKRLVGTRTSVSSILGSEESNGGATLRVLLRRHPLQQVSLTPHQTNRAASAIVVTQFLLGGPVCVSFGPSVAFRQADAFSSSCTGCGSRSASRITRVRLRVQRLGRFRVF